ncbi:MAG: NUDIX domain-containing protein [Pseudomonadota bacterium]
MADPKDEKPRPARAASQNPGIDDSTEELFATFTEAGEPLGLVPRSQVHAQGLWHKSAQVFLFDAEGRLILQKRSADKDVCPGLWDQSAAEHLKPGESWLEGALRGLEEELGVTGITLTALGDPFHGRLDQPELGIHDYELQQAFRGRWDGALDPDPVEVAEVRALAIEELTNWARRSPEAFTPWFLRDAVRCGILDLSLDGNPEAD